jgi:hypothetical protein
MSGLAGQAFVAIWHDVAPEGRANYYEWHNREHMAERVGIPGFRRGRRYITERGAPEYFNLYEVDALEVLTGQDYLARLNNPTSWTRRTVPDIRNVSRSLCRVDASVGCAQGGAMMTWRLEGIEGQEEVLRRYLRESLPVVFDRPGVLGAHFGTADRSRSEIMTEERRARGTLTLVPGWVILVEGISAAAVEAAADPELGIPALRGHGATEDIQRGIYRLEASRAKTAAVSG